jgi:hypothetical protein
MNKNIVGLVMFVLGFVGFLVFVNSSVAYGLNFNFLDTNKYMVDQLVMAYNLQWHYVLVIFVFLIGIILLLIDPIVWVVKKIRS